MGNIILIALLIGAVYCGIETIDEAIRENEALDRELEEIYK